MDLGLQVKLGRQEVQVIRAGIGGDPSLTYTPLPTIFIDWKSLLDPSWNPLGNPNL